MSKQIVELAFGGGTDKAVELLSDEMRRPISLGTDWTHLAIAYRADVGPRNVFGTMGDGVLPLPGFCLGVCNGNNGPITGDNCAHFVGVAAGVDYSNADLDVDTGSTRRRASVPEAAFKVTKIENGVASYAAFSFDAAIYHGTVAGAIADAATYAYPVAQCISISKSGSTYTVDGAIASSSSYPTYAYAESQLVTGLNTLSMSDFANLFGRTYACPGGSVTVDEATYGSLDTAVLTWPECFMPLRVYSFAVKKWA